jgi:hypothetical protein
LYLEEDSQFGSFCRRIGRTHMSRMKRLISSAPING